MTSTYTKMSTEEYYHVFESILYAGIVTQILVGWSKQLTTKEEYKVYWAHTLLSALLFVLVISRYFEFRTLSHFKEITNVAGFLFYVVLGPSLFFVAIMTLYPRDYKGIDLREFTTERMKFIMGPMTIYGIHITYRNLFIADHTIAMEIPSFINIAFTGILTFYPNLRLLEIFVVLNAIGMCFFIFR